MFRRRARPTPTAAFPSQRGQSKSQRNPAQSGTWMTDYNLIKDFDVSDADIDAALSATFGGGDMSAVMDRAQLPAISANFDPNQILKAKIIALTENEAILDVGLKSEGLVPLNEWDDPSSI